MIEPVALRPALPPTPICPVSGVSCYSGGSTTAAGATTTIAYDPAGNVTQITRPDGSLLAYSYDAANRLVRVSDAVDEHIDYTLDPLGGRTLDGAQENLAEKDSNRARERAEENINHTRAKSSLDPERFRILARMGMVMVQQFFAMGRWACRCGVAARASRGGRR
jgi:YD repeat-containing protein